MTNQALARARQGDGEAFRELTDPYRRELQVHCYRILGSVQDAEDMLQETLMAAWRGLSRFEGRASLRAWLYRIATNRCLNALRDKRRQPVPLPAPQLPEPTRLAEPIWLEPYPDILLEGIPDQAPGPEARYETKESLELAFIAGLQHLTPRGRVVLVLRDVLGFRAAEVADILGTSDVSVKGALQRARAALETRLPAGDRQSVPRPKSPDEREIAGRFAEAIENGDVDGMVALLTDDAWLTMPPQPHEYQGHMAIATFLAHGARLHGAPLRLIATRANTQPAFGCYLRDPHTDTAHAYGLLVLTLKGDLVSAIAWFSSTNTFSRFALPQTV
ncbi:sigma-70 family RNA polymerase sigma factor [Nonomuraea sp. M3C6]|uniref:Sigma-70 family RNA polymerase sigma factor n=1 Tax=Nonomuraea marmarensis TaxID=3351344 RepID=A0ABW7AXV2_9ACTN